MQNRADLLIVVFLPLDVVAPVPFGPDQEFELRIQTTAIPARGLMMLNSIPGIDGEGRSGSAKAEAPRPEY